MTATSAAALFHVLAFLTASALYVMLAAMTLGARPRDSEGQGPAANRADLIPLATAFLGLIWNVGELIMYGFRATAAAAPPWLIVVAFSALFYLPAVVVHSALAGAALLRPGGRRSAARALVVAAYALATVGTGLNLIATVRGEIVPSPASSAILGIGFATIVVLLMYYSRRQPAWRRALPAAGVAAFAVMLAHFTQHTTFADHWLTELVGHHGSLLVVLVILYQDYRFALADLFLKRAVTLLVITSLAAALYAGLVVPFVLPGLAGGADARTADPLAAAALLALWVGTALAYPRLRQIVNTFVDRTVLRRPAAGQVLVDITAASAVLTSVDAVLDAVCAGLARGLSATRTTWMVDPAPAAADPPPGIAEASVTALPGGRETVVRVATADAPTYRILIGGLSGGRRLLSDDYALLDGAARIAGRRIDVLRVAHERCERDVREQQIMRLATEAELRALRAQLNPHFLFNALTTIGYLIREAPDRALDTLWRLTDVMRAVLKRSDGEFTTLGEELDIVSAYLAIERARFEDRLRVTTDVSPDLGMLRIPPLVLQPVVENAVKHGIGSLVRGGCIIISARIEDVTAPIDGAGAIDGAHRRRLCLTVTDTGMGTAPSELATRRRAGTGLTNIERRLERYFGPSASLDIRSAVGVGTTVDIRLPAVVREVTRVPA